jgi:integrase
VGTFIRGLAAAFHWAVKKRLVTVNPVADVERPAARGKARKGLISPQEHARLLAAGRSRRFKEVLVALKNTGCRPGELCAAEAKYWNEELGAIVYRGDDIRREDEFAHKTSGKGKDRTIMFHDEGLALVRELIRRHPTGPLFRTQKGQPWTTMTIGRRFRELRQRAGLPREITPYSYRHSFCTVLLKAGKSGDVVANVVGNSPEVLRRHYGHLDQDPAALRRQLDEFFADGGGKK